MKTEETKNVRPSGASSNIGKTVIFSVLAAVVFACTINATPMSSANYMITWDVNDSASGNVLVSAFYRIMGSMAQTAAEFAQSTNYSVQSGFWAQSLDAVPYGADWTLATGNAFTTGRFNHTTVMYNDGGGDKLWVIGGASSGPMFNDVWWTMNGVDWNMATGNAAFSGREGHASCVYDGKMWVIAGWDVTARNDVWWSNNGSDWTLATGNAAFTPRMNSEVLVFNDRMYLIAGYGNSPAFKNDIWESTNGADWTLVTGNAFATFGRGMHTACVYNDGSGLKMWVLGGQGTSGEIDEVYWSLNGADWNAATLTAEFGNRSYSQALEFNGRMFLLGGYDGSVAHRDVWASYDGVTWVTETAAANWNIRMGHAGAVFDAGIGLRIWITGGFDMSSVYYTDAWYSDDTAVPTPTPAVFTDPGADWVLATGNAGFTPRNSHELLVYNNMLWVIGGDDGVRKSDVWSSTDGVSWELKTSAAAFGDRSNLGACVYDDGTGSKMWIAGGITASYQDDVYWSADGITWNLAVDGAPFGARMRPEMTAFKGKLWLICGRLSGNIWPNDVWVSENGSDWALANNNTPFPGRDDFELLVYNDKLWVIGGYNDGIRYNDVWWSDNGVDWNIATGNAAFTARSSFAAYVYDDGTGQKMWIAAGDSGGGREVWYSADGIAWTLKTSTAAFWDRNFTDGGVLNGSMWIVGGISSSYVTRYADAWWSGSVIQPTETYTPVDTPTPLPTPTMTLDWWEEHLSPAEQPAETGYNDSPDASAPLVPLNSRGGGYVSYYDEAGETGDEDHYRFIVDSPDAWTGHDILVIRLYAPEKADYGLTIFEESGGSYNNQAGWAYASQGNTATVIVDVSAYALPQEFMAQVRSTRDISNEPYTLDIRIFDSGTISGTLTLIGVQGSGPANVEVSAVYGYNRIGSSNTDAAGNYAVKVPVGIQIERLEAARWWQPGMPDDWAYGRTFYETGGITAVSAGSDLAGHNFNVYREGFIEGRITAAGSVNIEVMDQYSKEHVENVYNTINAYGIHNLAPGTYALWVEPNAGYGSGIAVSYTANVAVRDGFKTELNYNLGSGYTVSGAFNPIPLQTTYTVEVYTAGASRYGKDLFREYYRLPFSGSTYTINELPAGVYDFYPGGGGPSQWDARLGVVVGGPTTVNFTGPAVDSFISGTVIDWTGNFDFAADEIAVYAISTGTADIMGPYTKGYGTNVSGTAGIGNFSMAVAGAYGYYDLVVVKEGNDGPGQFLAWAYDVATQTANVAFNIYDGAQMSGDILYNSNPLWMYGLQGFVTVFKDAGGAWKFVDFIDSQAGGYQISPYMQPADLKLEAQSPYMETGVLYENIGTSDESGRDINVTLDNSKDRYFPYTGYLYPVHNGTLPAPDDLLYVTVDDYTLGTGADWPDIRSDGVAVENLAVFASNGNFVTYEFNLPSAHRNPGSKHFISINVNDQQGNVHANPVGDWIVNVAGLTSDCDAWGNTGNGSSVSTTQGYMYATRYYLTAGKLTDLHVNIGNYPSGTIRTALYAESAGDPGSLMGISDEVPVSAAGWVTTPYSVPIDIPADGYYWLAFHTSDSPVEARYFPMTDVSRRNSTSAYGTWPDPYIVDANTVHEWDIYATVCRPVGVNNFTKTADPARVKPGDPVLYTMHYDVNNISNVVINDQVPDNSTLNSVSPGGTSSCTTPGCQITWNLPDAAGNSKGVVWFFATVDNTVTPGTVINNSAHMGFAEYSAGMNTNSTTVYTDGVVISKSQQVPSIANVGDTVTYNINYSVEGFKFKDSEGFDGLATGAIYNEGTGAPPGWKFQLFSGNSGDWEVKSGINGDKYLEASDTLSNQFPLLLRDDGNITDSSDQFCTGMIITDVMISGTDTGADAEVIIRANAETNSFNVYGYSLILSVDNNPGYVAFEKVNAGTASWPMTLGINDPGIRIDAWFRVKIVAAQNGNDYIFSAKVWERGTPEPPEWTIHWVDINSAVNMNFNCSTGTWTNWNPGFGLQRGTNEVLDSYDNFYTFDFQKATSAVVYDTIPACLQYMASGPSAGLSGNVLSWALPSPITQTSGSIWWMGRITCAASITNLASFAADEWSPVKDSNTVSFTVAEYTATSTPYQTETLTITETVTPTGTATVTETITETITGTVTATNTETVTGTNTPTVSETVTETITGTVTETATATITETNSMTVTKTSTETVTETITETFSPTISQTNTPTVFGTATETITETITITSSPTITNTNSPTVSETATQTVTQTTTPTLTLTLTLTNTVTETVTPTSPPTVSQTSTQTVTETEVPSDTITPTNTPTQSETITMTISPTSSSTDSATPTFTSTFTLTDSSTPTLTGTPTFTFTFTGTSTSTPTFTPTNTSTATFTQTDSPTNSPTLTDTPTFTATQSYTDTPTNSATPTYTRTNTDTPTESPTHSATNTWTYTPTPSITLTHTITPTFTNTPLPNENLVLDRNYMNVTEGDTMSVKAKRDAAGTASVKIKIYNLSGELVKHIPVQEISLIAGWNEISAWDGKNDAGNTVGRGIYFVVIIVDNDKQMRRIMLIK